MMQLPGRRPDHRRASESLKVADRLNLNLSPDLALSYRAVAIDDMELEERRRARCSRRAAGQGGERRLQCRRLDRGSATQAHPPGGPGGPTARSSTLDARAGGGAGEAPRHRAALQFKFDEQGRLSELQGNPGRLSEPRVPSFAVLTSEPVPPATTAGAAHPERALRDDLDPADGGREGGTFQGGVEFIEPRRRASAHNGASTRRAPGPSRSRAAEPRVSDEAQGSELRGREIELGTRSGDVSARENVRHRSRAGRRRARRGRSPATSRRSSCAGTSTTTRRRSRPATRTTRSCARATTRSAPR